MHSIFEKLIILRNLLYGVNEKFCLLNLKTAFSVRTISFLKAEDFTIAKIEMVKQLKDANLTTFLHPLMIFDQKVRILILEVE